MPCIIDKRGFVLEKRLVSQELKKLIDSELTVCPELSTEYKTAVSFKVYKEDDKYYYLPKWWAIDNIDSDAIIKFKNKSKNVANIKFKGCLRAHQIDIINTMIDIFYNKKTNKLNNHAGGCIVIPPGKGKTVLGLCLASFIKRRTLIIVHKTFLLEQWIERATSYTNANIGIICQNKVDVRGKQIVIGMLQSLNSRDYGDILDMFDLVIFDEVHHLGAEHFCKILQKSNRPYLLGLTGTPERKDKMEKIFYWYIGPISYRMEHKVDQNVKIQIYKFNMENNIKFKMLYNNYTKKYNFSKMISNLTEINERNELIVKIIQNTLIEASGRQIFLLTNRRDHLIELKKKLDSIYGTDNVAFYKGGMKKEDLKISESKRIILGTYEMASEGLDIEDLDTLILATPKSDIVQSIGRIMRKNKNDYINTPLIIDIYDQLPIYMAMAKNRIKIYKQNYLQNNKDMVFYECNDDTKFEIVRTSYMEIVEEQTVLTKDDYKSMFDSDSD